jgi:hypothetical protein
MDKLKSLFLKVQLLHKIAFTPLLYKKVNPLTSRIWKEIKLKFDSEETGSILTNWTKKMLFRFFDILHSNQRTFYETLYLYLVCLQYDILLNMPRMTHA